MSIETQHLNAMSAEEWIEYVDKNSLSGEDLAWLFKELPGEPLGNALLTDVENLPVLTEAFLKRGMDPDGLVLFDVEEHDGIEYKYFDTSLITCLQYWNGGPEVEAMKILLEHGADPNTIYDKMDENYYRTVFDFFDECPYIHGEHMEPGEFYGLLLCSAYGGVCRDGVPSFEMLTDDSITVFKDYSKYWFEYDDKTMYVIDKESNRRVAKYRWTNYMWDCLRE